MQQFSLLLRGTIPDEDCRDTKVLDQCISNFWKMKRIVIEQDLTGIDYVMYKCVSYFAESDGTMNSQLLYGILQATIESFMVDPQVKLNEVLKGSERGYDLKVPGEFEQAKREFEQAIAFYYSDMMGEVVTPHQFNSLLKLYSAQMYDAAYLKILQTTAVIATKGMEVVERGLGRRFIKGTDESSEYFFRNFALLKSKYNLDEEEDFDTSGDISQIDRMKKKAEAMYDAVANTGIKAIDEALKDFRRTQLLGIESGSGVGKSRFARSIAYIALTKFKKNVLDITLEQESSEIWAMYTAMHLFKKWGIKVEDSDIKRDTVEEHLRPMVDVARYDLFDNPDYGRLRIKSTELYVDEMFGMLIGMHKSEFKFDMLLLDYASLVQENKWASERYGSASNMYKVVTQVYKDTKSKICRGLKVFALVVNQLGREGVEKLAKGELTSTYDASNSGETYKSADANLVLGSNESLDIENKMQISSPKFRDSKKFYRVIVKADLAVCHFEDAREEEIDKDTFDRELEDTMVA